MSNEHNSPKDALYENGGAGWDDVVAGMQRYVDRIEDDEREEHRRRVIANRENRRREEHRNARNEDYRRRDYDNN